MKKIITTAICAAALVSGSAFAAGAQTGLVFGGHLGYSYATGELKGDTLADDFRMTGSSVSQNNGNIAGGLFVGYDMALNKMLSIGLELGGQYAHDISKVSASEGTESFERKSSVISVPMFLTGKLYIPHTAGLNVFGKAGYAYNRVNNKFSGNVSTSLGLSKEHITLWRPVVAAGIGYQIHQFNIFAQYQYNFLPYAGENSGLGTVSAGVSYTLPM